MKIIGWDPGANGAFAFRIDGGVKTVRPPEDDENLARLIQLMAGIHPVTVVYESQTGVSYGGARESQPSMFKFGTGFGKVLGAIAMLSIARSTNGLQPIVMEKVAPTLWQPSFDLDFKKAVKKKDYPGTEREYRNYKAQVKRERKAALRDHALSLYQGQKLLQQVTLDNCDALLLLHYGEQKFTLGLPEDR